MRSVRINRSERRPPFLSNIVPGGAEQVTPNGTTYDKAPDEQTGVQGATPQPPVPPIGWGPNANRSGE